MDWREYSGDPRFMVSAYESECPECGEAVTVHPMITDPDYTGYLTPESDRKALLRHGETATIVTISGLGKTIPTDEDLLKYAERRLRDNHR